MAARQTGQHHHGDHQHRAHRRQREPGGGGIGHGACQRHRTGHLRTGYPPRQRGKQPPQSRPDQCAAACHQPHMESGDRDEMGQARGAQDLPVRIVQRPRVAQRQGAHEAGRVAGYFPRDALRHGIAPGVDPAGRCQFPGQGRMADVTGRRDTLRHRMAFGIHPAGIGQSPRRTHAHVQPPAFARTEPCAGPGHLGTEVVVPRQSDQFPAQRRRLCVGIVHPQQEPRAPGLRFRQAHHASTDDDIAPLPGRRQLRTEAPRGMQAGPGRARQHRPRPAPTCACAPATYPCDQSEPQNGDRRQCRRPQHSHHAQQDRCGTCQAERRQRISCRKGGGRHVSGPAG